MQDPSCDNNGHKFIRTMIRIFTKRVWAILIKNKSGKEILIAFHQLFKDAHARKPSRLQRDAGKELLNMDVQ